MPTELDDWFVREVLPLEAALTRFLRRHRQPSDDVADLLQEVMCASMKAPAAAGRSWCSRLPLQLRCGEVVRMRKIDGMSQREVAQHLGISEDTVEKQISKGMRVLAHAMLLKGVVVSMSNMVTRIRGRQEQKGGKP